MKEERRVAAKERDAAYAKLSLPEKFARALNAPGKAEKELRRLYTSWLMLNKVYPTDNLCRSYALGLDSDDIRDRCLSIMEVRKSELSP